jgi:hypothetical protein
MYVYICEYLCIESNTYIYIYIEIFIIGSFATIPLFENTQELLDFQLEKNIVFDIGISCCMAVALNTSNYLGIYMYVDNKKYTCMFVCLYVCIYVCMYLCMYVSMDVYIHIYVKRNHI